jgi:hypothetical protein
MKLRTMALAGALAVLSSTFALAQSGGAERRRRRRYCCGRLRSNRLWDNRDHDGLSHEGS